MAAAGPGGAPGIAAIMAAIGHEVGGPATPAAAPDVPVITAPDAVPASAAAVSPPALDGEVRAMLAAVLREWLDAHLPEIVETAVTAEIRRLTGQIEQPIDKHGAGA